ncbi:MAG: exonuclease SbcCD subunit D C-terminal domain-containing protein [Candidatus Sericytochromatia bacterium]|nr:exonuclease SbcCD subunit D C-terminal domain-containing protein [Candidatus Sericytochromatia bacterium]
MRILHTSDWHLGRQLIQKSRDDEFEAFLAWLAALLVEERVETLVIAGDLFDTTTPSHVAQGQYYDFLRKARQTSCRHIIVVAGNHDSPSLVDAPRDLLEALDITVVGGAPQDPAGCVRLLRDAQGHPELIACAVPFLRDRDLLTSEAGETSVDREQRLLSGIRSYYARTAAAAVTLREAHGAGLPILATGHLFAAGGTIVDDDGVRDLYVGGIGAVPTTAFPEAFDYVALGHIHRPQAVGGSDRIRYSGAPLAMGFGEAGQTKSVSLVDLEPGNITVRTRPVPQRRRLLRLAGDRLMLERALGDLAREKEALPAWIEATYRDTALHPDLREGLETILAGTPHELLRLRDLRLLEVGPLATESLQDLADLNVETVFRQLLDARAVPDVQRVRLETDFAEVLHTVLHTEAPGSAIRESGRT